jgi:20S proteasome subunit beta 1
MSEGYKPGDLKPGEVNLGTTIMAVAFDGGVVIGADTRTSTGRYIANRASDKLTQITSHIFVCRSGSAADTQSISDVVRVQMAHHELELGRRPQVQTCATLFQNMCYEYKEQISAGIICAGYDDVEGGVVYNIPVGGSMVKLPYTIGGSGSTYIYGYCDANYKPNMTREECLSFVKTCVALAIHRDGSSGGNIRTCVITKDGFEKNFIPGSELPTF